EARAPASPRSGIRTGVASAVESEPLRKRDRRPPVEFGVELLLRPREASFNAQPLDDPAAQHGEGGQEVQAGECISAEAGLIAAVAQRGGYRVIPEAEHLRPVAAPHQRLRLPGRGVLVSAG